MELEMMRLHRLARMPYRSLPTHHCHVTYVWINVTGAEPKSKTRILDFEPKTIKDVPRWYATYFFEGVNHEITLIPVRIFRDPFLLDPNKLVLCETQTLEGTPAPGNRRPDCVEAMASAEGHKAWFGFEQEFLLCSVDERPLGWGSSLSEQRVVSGSIGLNHVCGRDVSISHCQACLYAGIKIAGINGEDLPSQWEFQVGPCEGLELGDQAWMARYILHRVCEEFGVIASLHPNPVEHVTCGNGGHMNFSTESMRAKGGIK